MPDLLMFRFVLLNSAFLTGVFLLHWGGYIVPLFVEDATGITYGIVGLLGLGLSMVFLRVCAVTSMLNGNTHSHVKVFMSRIKVNIPTATEALRVKLDSRLAPIEYLGYLLVTLGFTGTVIGFRIALSGVEMDSLGDVAGVTAMATSLISGMAVAINTTIVGIAGYMWLGCNVRLLDGGHQRLYTKLLDGGES